MRCDQHHTSLPLDVCVRLYVPLLAGHVLSHVGEVTVDRLLEEHKVQRHFF